MALKLSDIQSGKSSAKKQTNDQTDEFAQKLDNSQVEKTNPDEKQSVVKPWQGPTRELDLLEKILLAKPPADQKRKRPSPKMATAKHEDDEDSILKELKSLIKKASRTEQKEKQA